MLATGNFVSEGDVIENDLVMGRSEFGHKFTFNIVPILKKFFFLMWEGKTNGSSSSSPC